MFRKLHEPTSASVTIDVDGVPTVAEPHETVAAVLLRQPEAWSRLSPVTRSRRGPYCMMGVCFDCLAEVNGVASVQTCLKLVCDGMTVVRQVSTRRISR